MAHRDPTCPSQSLRKEEGGPPQQRHT
ncbi:hypothetical protein CSHISOI_00619 [Colletotrichum shisoi]|uniref:Uncharacterized protein n=1 Tax=Colletotrichum shisoi TaxID=2078593 RepID=A0A5Q4C5X8_9PEZI|nr:hypothetical protein CSHISOI_00619 [Colletotrichum shisoi]